MSSIAANILNTEVIHQFRLLYSSLVFENANPISLVVGFLIAVVGELIRFWGVSWAGSETRTTGGVGGSNLIISGPFAYVRNPLYVGNILMYFGLGVMSLALFPYLQIVAITFFILQYQLIVGEEESFLKTKFGDQYKRFLENVPKFFPRLTPYKDEKNIQPKVSYAKGFKSEIRTLQAFSIVVVLIIIKWYLRVNNIL